MTTTNDFSLSKLDPAEWTVYGYFYVGQDPDLHKAYQDDVNALKAALDSVGLDLSDIRLHDNGGCAHCGANYAHGVAVYRASDSTVLGIGATCATERFGLATKQDLRDKYGARNRSRAAGAWEAFVASHEGLVEALTTDHYIVADVARQGVRKGQLSDAQVKLVFKLAHEAAERAAAQAARLATAEPCPTGRVTITGRVISFKEVTNDYGTTWKMLVEDDRGFRVYGTQPNVTLNRGDRVTFSAQVTPSDNDPLFGFYKRPTKAQALAV